MNHLKEIMSKANTRRTLVKLQDAYPDAQCKLNHESPFQLLVATMLAAQSNDEQVNALTDRLFKKYATPMDYAALTPDALQEEIQELGIFRAKADHIIGAARRILDWHVGEVPRTQEELVRLPGIGRKTANLVVANGYGIPAFAVDTHVQRASNRIGFSNSMNPEITEKQLCQRIPRHLWIESHHLLIRLGKEVCTARNPKCETCPVSGVCQFYVRLQEDEKLREKVFVESKVSTIPPMDIR